MSSSNNTTPKGTSLRSARSITSIGMLSAISFVLMFFDFSIPLVPSFIKLDISDLPALIGSFALGPVAGVIISLVKNLLHLLRTSTGGVGELSNFILSSIFVATAGAIYKYKNNRTGALVGSLAGALAMAILSVPSNYFLVYPVYTAFMPLEAIIGAYQAINPNVNGLLSCLVIFNMPFTFFKAMLSVIIAFVIYKKISPIIKGSNY